MKDSLFNAFQYIVPQHAISRIAGWLANTSVTWIKNPFTRWFVKRYDIDMSLAKESDPCAYASFNDFFTRALRDDARPICDEQDTVVFPADGSISQWGDIVSGRVFQAKGQSYSLVELLGGDEAAAKPFQGGNFATVYLSPKDYHRVHMPLAGRLTSMVHVPGDLFSVNDTTAENVPRLFSRNERAVCFFETEAGPMAIVLVGAMIVASIETVWAGQITPEARTVKTTEYGQIQDFAFATGDEMGRFKLGSTAVVVFGPDAVKWREDYHAGSPTKMGEKMGDVIKS